MSHLAESIHRAPAALAVIAALAACAAGSAVAGELKPGHHEKIRDATRTFHEFLTARDREIPEDLLPESSCVAMIPGVAKGAFGIGGRYGKGLISCRQPGGGWGPPAFVELGGVSFGFQIGGEVMNLMLVVMNPEGAEKLVRNKVKLGGDIGVAAGPYGRTLEAATDAQLHAGILTYARTKGAFAGASLEGAVLKGDRSDNQRLYGRSVKLQDVLLPEKGEELPIPEAVEMFVEALEERAPAGSN